MDVAVPTLFTPSVTTVRVAIFAECFLPERNGVTNSVLRVVDHLERRGHEAIVIAPGCGPTRYSETPVERMPAVDLPVYRSLSVGLPSGRLRTLLERFEPDVVHAAAPAVLGAAGLRAAKAMGIPSVAIYQTDLAGFATRYGFKALSPTIWRYLRWVHDQATLTLAPSSLAAWELARHGIDRVDRWGRGVDLDAFHPRHRNALLRRRWAPHGELVVGYVGRLAKEKQVHLLAGLDRMRGVRVVVAGDGPMRSQLESRLPGANFLGFVTGPELSHVMASLDVFVHTGANETFCQAIQEALASGVPVVAPASGGPVDLVLHGDNGWLFPADAPEFVQPAVLELLSDADRRHAMGRRARASVEQRSWARIGDELIEHYRRVCGAPHRTWRVA